MAGRGWEGAEQCLSRQGSPWGKATRPLPAHLPRGQPQAHSSGGPAAAGHSGRLALIVGLFNRITVLVPGLFCELSCPYHEGEAGQAEPLACRRGGQLR